MGFFKSLGRSMMLPIKATNKLVSKSPGMGGISNALGSMPGNKFNPMMQGMGQPKPGIGPTTPPIPTPSPVPDANPMMEGGEMGAPPMQAEPQIQPQAPQAQMNPQQMMLQQFMGQNPQFMQSGFGNMFQKMLGRKYPQMQMQQKTKPMMGQGMTGPGIGPSGPMM